MIIVITIARNLQNPEACSKQGFFVILPFVLSNLSVLYVEGAALIFVDGFDRGFIVRCVQVVYMPI